MFSSSLPSSDVRNLTRDLNIFETAFENDNVRKSLTQDELPITVGGVCSPDAA